jgi:Leucine-rich repeat (LRR) protein
MHEKIERLEDVQVDSSVTQVNLRQNRITEISSVPWLAQLEELDLYDNGISEIKNLEVCTKLRSTASVTSIRL